MKRLVLVSTVLLVLQVALPAARAQYRNQVFSVGGGYSMLMGEMDNMQLSGTPMLGGEYRWKLLSDHWWLVVRMLVGFRAHKDDYAANALGTMLDVKPGINIRYVFLTHDFRPYIQLGTTYSTLWYFTEPSQDVLDNYLPHSNWGTINLQPGFEYVFMRNVSLQLALDIERILIWSGDDGWMLLFTGLLNFYI